MPFIEFVLTIIGYGIVLAVLIGLFLVSAAIFFYVMGASLLLGWIPILMCATDIYMNVGEGFFGNWALLSIWIYAICSAGIVALMVFKPDPDGLPAAWKFVAMFYSVREKYNVNAASFDASKFGDGVRSRPGTVYGMRMMDRVFKSSQTRMAKRAKRFEDETEAYLNSTKDRATEAENLMRAEARNRATNKWREKNDGEGS